MNYRCQLPMFTISFSVLKILIPPILNMVFMVVFDLSIVQPDDASGALSNVSFVGYDYDCDPFIVEMVKKIHYFHGC